MPFINRL